MPICVLFFVAPVFGSIAVKYQPLFEPETNARRYVVDPNVCEAITAVRPSLVYGVWMLPDAPVVTSAATLVTLVMLSSDTESQNSSLRPCVVLPFVDVNLTVVIE